jgi:glycosyltransferase involved in cell wall biosynthesis
MISFIVPAHNEEPFVGRAVSSIHRTMHRLGEPYEIVVVDDSSSDATAQIARENGARVLRVEYRQIAATRNAGARAACGDLLCFVDADTRANRQAVHAACKAIRAGAVAGGCVFRYDVPLPLWARIAHPVAVALGRRLKLVGGCFLFCRRDTFEAVGGFSEQYFAAEELVFIAAVKRRGPFVVPTPAVTTSARKIWRVSMADLADLLRHWLFSRDWFQKRDGLDLWYGPRPHDTVYERLSGRTEDSAKVG